MAHESLQKLAGPGQGLATAETCHPLSAFQTILHNAGVNGLQPQPVQNGRRNVEFLQHLSMPDSLPSDQGGLHASKVQHHSILARVAQKCLHLPAIPFPATLDRYRVGKDKLPDLP